MAEEVGAAFVSLVPSARGFSTKARAEIRKDMAGKDIAVPVKPEVDRADVTRALTGATAGERGTVPIATSVDAGQLRREVRTAVLATEATRPTVHINTDVDRNLFRRSLLGLLPTVAQSGGRLGGSFLTGFGSSLLKPSAITAAIVGALVLSTPLVSAATLLGSSLAGIVLAGFALRGNPKLKAALSGLLGDIDEGLTKAAQPLVQPFLQAIGILRDAFRTVAPDVRDLFAAVAPYIPVLAEGVAGFLQAFTPDLVTAVKASAPVIQQFAQALPDIGDALGQFLTSVSLVAPQAAIFFGAFLRTTADAIRAFGSFVGFITRGSQLIVSAIKFVVEIFREAVLGWQIIFRKEKEFLGGMVAAVDSFINRIKGPWNSFWRHLIPSTTSIGLGQVVATVRGLPGRVIAVLSGLGGALYRAGRNIMHSLVQGIRDSFPSLRGVMSNAASIARSFWPFSPAKQGPLSGRGSLFYAGQNLAGDVAAGMRSGLPMVTSASDQLAGAVGVGGAGMGGSAVAAAPAQVVIGSDGSRLGDLLVEVLQGAVRNRGGNVQFVLGTSRG